MKKRKISQALLDLLGSGRWNDFTISELKAAYIALPNCPHRTEKAAWQFVYRNVVRMEGRGMLSRLANEEGTKLRYVWTAAGMRTAEAPMKIHSASNEDETMTCLREKLHRYKVEMLSAIGETEEYDAICTELPHMRDAVQDYYNEARDRCSKILGRVRALESILSNQFHWQQPS